jgi:hypothetical protein
VASNRNLKSDDVEGFMLAVWDSFADLAADYDVGIGIGVGPRATRGHLMFRATAFRQHESGHDVAVATAEVVWPTHYAKTVHALLYALLVRLWRELDTELTERVRAIPARPVDEAPNGA